MYFLYKHIFIIVFPLFYRANCVGHVTDRSQINHSELDPTVMD